MNRFEQDWEKKRLWLAAIPAIVMVVLLWLVYLIIYTGITSLDLRLLGVLPRHFSGWVGVLFAPLIHDSFSHLLSNTLPVFLLTWCLFYFYRQVAFKAMICMWLLSGIFTWIIGRESYHVGVSGLIFSLVFFMFVSGVLRRHIPLIAISLLVVFLYGSSLWSMLPLTEWIDPRISWEAHLSGAISGGIFAFVFRHQGPQRPQNIWEEEDEDDEMLFMEDKEYSEQEDEKEE